MGEMNRFFLGSFFCNVEKRFKLNRVWAAISLGFMDLSTGSGMSGRADRSVWLLGGTRLGCGSADRLAGAVQPIAPKIRLRANRDPPILRLSRWFFMNAR